MKANELSRKEVEVLRVLSESSEPLSSAVIKRELERKGFFLSERAVRYHLQALKLRGLVHEHRRGENSITPQGLEELSRSLVSQRLGFVITRFLSMAYSVTYNPADRRGTVVTNISVIDGELCDKALEYTKRLYDAGLLLAPYVRVLEEGEEYGNVTVPEGKVALFTVCDLTIDGVLIRSGIPIFLKYGGLVQVVNNKPLRFIELISYEETTIPPLELLVRGGQTSVNKVVRTGSGVLPVAMREIVAEAREGVLNVLSNLREKGWRGILAVGAPNESVLGVSVAMDRFGLCMVGGVIVSAALVEEGIKVDTIAPHCLMPIEEMDTLR
ncbi:MAG: NrpR regulatory domain-containing protein [Candidatus Nezhaarchaeota archaeon]|nr:NrpR regulatory domain-containing protein [Candidatus Nezhaarchaeota archaeon]